MESTLSVFVGVTVRDRQINNADTKYDTRFRNVPLS